MPLEIQILKTSTRALTRAARSKCGRAKSVGYDGTNHLGLDDTAESGVSVPSDMIAIGDHWAFYFALELSDIWPVHDKGANVVFCDNHVEYAKIREWTKADDVHRRRWNNDHQAHPEAWPENQDGYNANLWWNY